jgi:hypothetical protein
MFAITTAIFSPTCTARPGLGAAQRRTSAFSPSLCSCCLRKPCLRMACFGLLRIISGTPIAQPRYQPKLPIMASRRTVVDNKYCLVEEHHAVRVLMCGDEEARGCECCRQRVLFWGKFHIYSGFRRVHSCFIDQRSRASGRGAHAARVRGRGARSGSARAASCAPPPPRILITNNNFIYTTYSIHSLPWLVLLYDTDWDRWGSTRVHKLFSIAVYICLRLSVLAICCLPTATMMWGGTGQLSPI